MVSNSSKSASAKKPGFPSSALQVRSAVAVASSKVRPARARHLARRKTAMRSRHSKTRPTPSRSGRCNSSNSSRRFRCQTPWSDAAETMLKRASVTLRGFLTCARHSKRNKSTRSCTCSTFPASAPMRLAAAPAAKAAETPSAASARRRPSEAPARTAAPCGRPGRHNFSKTNAYSQTQGASSSMDALSPTATAARAWTSTKAKASARAAGWPSKAAAASGSTAAP
mmetsp:Transcript_105082/g.263202  ORF Transcript_105082/g.263202 Transcript_105082/m.263202 type:complete len:226 (-) Transcript_105082:1520-2197(-)